MGPGIMTAVEEFLQLLGLMEVGTDSVVFICFTDYT